MNWKLLTLPLAIFFTPFFLATACEPCEEDQCSFDGLGGADGESGGADSGGSSSGGSSSGGTGGSGGTEAGGEPGVAGEGGGAATGGEGGSGAAANLDCQSDGTTAGTEGSCVPVSDIGDSNYDCEACVQEYCCAEFEACNASDPVTACRFGSTLSGGEPIEGEFDCMLSCLRGLEGALGDAYDVATCAGECGSSECNPNEAGPFAADLISCMLGIDNEDNPLGCQDACAMLPE
jgi:hypothetical protein